MKLRLNVRFIDSEASDEVEESFDGYSLLCTVKVLIVLLFYSLNRMSRRIQVFDGLLRTEIGEMCE